MKDRITSLLNEAGAGSGMLSESAAKEIMRLQGISTPQGRLCATADEAVSTAEEFGYPLVMKIVSPQISHKSDAGGVRVGIDSADAVRAAFDGICTSVRQYRPDAEITGILVEQMAVGHELLIGASRTDFGPLLLFGLGGVTVELLRDVSYRLAPLDQAEALSMIREIRAYPLLEGFRGQAPVDVDALADILMRVSRLTVEYPQIRELDINPLLAQGNRMVVADARIAVDQAGSVAPQLDSESELSREDVDALFAPRAIAVVGATVGRYNRGKAWLTRVEKAGYKGNLYAVSRRDQVEHWPTFPRLADIPERPDLVMVEVGRDAVPSVIEDCVSSGIPWVSVHTSGYAETGTEEGAERLRELQAQVEGTRTHLIGPNAMGPYSPANGIVPAEVTQKSGSLALLSQSGVTFLAFGKMAQEKDIGISKGVSYGSEAGVTVDVFLNYLAQDDETDIVAMYLEGVRRPRAFLTALQRVAMAKPVVILKGGITEAGARAVESHSGALAGSAEVWSALFAKTGAVHAETYEDLVDLVVAFTRTQGAFEKKLALVTPSGAAAVTYSDACFRQGFELATLSSATQERIRELLPAGTSAKNPVDVAQGYFRRESMPGILAALAADENVPFLVFHLAMDVYATTIEYAPWAGETFLQTLVEAKANGKPMAVVMPYSVADAKRAEVERLLLSEGLPVFPTMDRALKAFSKVLAYRGRNVV